METRNFAALDIGAESGRAVVGMFDGRTLKLSEVHRFPNRPVTVVGHLHWDALRLYDEIQIALERAAEQFGELASVGVDTWGVDFALLDASGELLGNPFHYRDHRTDGMMQEAFRRVPREMIFKTTGIQFMQLNTLYQLLAMTLSHSPTLEIAAKLLMLPDLFNYWLTGEQVSEFTIATTTQFYDPNKRTWAFDLLDRLGIPHAFLPPIVSPATDLGPLRPVSRQHSRLDWTHVIATACHDTQAAIAAVPVQHRDYAYISSGTWSLMGVEVREPVIDERTLAYNFTNEGGTGQRFCLLKNLTGLWLVQECRRAWAQSGDALTYSDMMDLAERARPFSALVDPDDSLFLNPTDMPKAIGQFCVRTGQKPPIERGAMIRCALESLAIKYRYTLDQLETLLNKRLEVIHIVGGGAQNQLLCQMAANACGRPVVAGPVEATSLGNILLQMTAQGLLHSSEEARGLSRDSFPVMTYLPKDSAEWTDAFAQFTGLIGSAGGPS